MSRTWRIVIVVLVVIVVLIGIGLTAHLIGSGRADLSGFFRRLHGGGN
jgi:hypothetical protein